MSMVLSHALFSTRFREAGINGASKTILDNMQNNFWPIIKLCVCKAGGLW